MYFSFNNPKVKVYTAKLYFVVLFLGVIQYGAAASVKAFKPDVYIVTPEPPSESQGRNFQPFLPTPLPDEESSTVNYRRRTSTGSPDIIIAEFRDGKNGTGSEKMLSVKEMLTREVIPGRFYVTPVEYKTTTTAKSTTAKENVMDVKDVWDIIKHNQDLETTPKPRTTTAEPRIKPVAVVKARKPIHPYPPADSKEYTVVESVKSVSADSDAWMDAEPEPPQLTKKPSSPVDVTIDEPRTIRGGSNYADSRLPARVSYYPAYRRPDTGFSNIDSSDNNYRLATGEAEDRYNPAQPYLPPHKPDDDKKPSLPPPPAPMPPPPPPPQPQPYMNAPSISYDSIPSYSHPDSSKPDTSGPPSDSSYSYPKPDDSGPPPSFDSSDDHHYHHDDFKFESPPDTHDSDNYPQLIYEDHHPHHDDHDHIVYHHHHHTTTTPPPPPPPTTAAPEKEDTRVTNRFSYYYLGKKLWYLPLYFSVYFIVYVGALIIKSIARHKITYPQHYKTKRSLGFNISENDLHNMTRLTCNALFNAAEKYFMKS